MDPMNRFGPLDVGRTFRIVPAGHTGPLEGRVPILLCRGAFGSGEHETTASCLEMLEGLSDMQGARALDLGTGTGILAVAALRLGARQVVCVDPDPRAIRVARSNLELNGLASHATLIAGTLAHCPPQSFDLVMANLYGDLLISLAPELMARARPGGLILLSGLLWEHYYDVRCRYEGGCEIVRQRMLEEFWTILLRRFSPG